MSLLLIFLLLSVIILVIILVMTLSTSGRETFIPIVNYYEKYEGHQLSHLTSIWNGLLNQGKKQIIWLVGDSSLDNKYWLESTVNVLNGYQTLLVNGKGKPDIAYWINYELVKAGILRSVCINTSVEGSSLRERTLKLLGQDNFVRDHLTSQDILICSVGGNDIELNLDKLVDRNSLPYFIDIFGRQTETYLKRLVSKTKPKLIIVCQTYYFDESPEESSWADLFLLHFQYNTNPSYLQGLIRTLFNKATQQIRIEGVVVIPFPLFKILDGKHREDYRERVEPSRIGGQKIASALVNLMLEKN